MSTLDLMRAALKPKPEKQTPVLDTALDSAASLPGASDYTETDITMSACAAVQEWAETDDLDEGETYADRLTALMVGVADANHDGEIGDDEQGVLEVALNAAWDYLTSLGVSDEDAGALLNDWDADAADRVRELVLSALPEGDDAASAAIDDFVFGGEAEEPALDAVYRKKMVIRHGKKMRINKRISGTVRLNAKQKVAIRKAQLKSHSAAARMRRMKSVHIRKKMGL